VLYYYYYYLDINFAGSLGAVLVVPVVGTSAIIACAGHAMGYATVNLCKPRSTSIWSGAGSVSNFPPILVV
jgi:hypothetical protein